ncbi:MAG: hypothetical protein AAFQ44_02185, partial [Pseudomonadota bacterium]
MTTLADRIAESSAFVRPHVGPGSVAATGHAVRLTASAAIPIETGRLKRLINDRMALPLKLSASGLAQPLLQSP